MSSVKTLRDLPFDIHYQIFTKLDYNQEKRTLHLLLIHTIENILQR